MDFEFPPATEEQLTRTETRLGYALPATLRAIYAGVANGGFGPGLGITGAESGYWYGEDGDIHYTTNDQPWTPWWPHARIDLRAYIERFKAEKRQRIPGLVWPERFLHLCYWGCGTDSYLDANTEGVYVVLDMGEKGLSLVQEAETLEAWLEVWLDGRRLDWWDPESVGDDLPF